MSYNYYESIGLKNNVEANYLEIVKMNNLTVGNNLVRINRRDISKNYNIEKSNKQLRRSVFGFTLIEVMIVVAVVGTLASIAYPSYVNHVTRSMRAEPLRELTRIANLQEQFFIDNNRYTADLSELGQGSTAGFETESENYIITSVIDAVNNTFVLTATAQGIQATRDHDCNTINITDTGSKTASTLASVASTNLCWEQ